MILDRRSLLLGFVVLSSCWLFSPLVAPLHAAGGTWTLVGWNNLGMHCMDPDYSVFSILPPYNTVHAQLIDPTGRRIANPAGYRVTFEAVRDASGSINTTSVDKTNFWQWVTALFGAAPAVDAGLAGVAMPGAANRPQAMTWDGAQRAWIAEGIPITPFDDAHRKNTYPMMRLVARDAAGALLAFTDVVLPVSDEMSCVTCHSSRSGPAARPDGGWVNDPNPDRDYRLNVLKLHDDRQRGSALYANALAQAGYLPTGLYPTALAGTPILCARCHGSNALPGTGIPGLSPLTAAVHARHAGAVDPGTGMTLDASVNRGACYTCHPGSTTRCLRGAMGGAVATDGSLAMQCQSCHGGMSAVGATARQGWLDEPTCQSCHTGTATNNRGQIRYTNAFDAPGHARTPADPIFATNSNAPAAGLSLYRFSFGHGGLACSACHGSTHAEYPATHPNDNVQSAAIQGHVGPLAECGACHGAPPRTTSGGPHGLHPLGPQWVRDHGDAAEHATSACRSCHGADYRGTVLSRSQADWTANTEWGQKRFWRGFQIGCYACHNGPDSESGNRNRPAAVTDTSASTPGSTPVAIALAASDPDGNPLTLRVVSQPAHGTAGLAGRIATYIPEAGFTGTDRFTFAAWDGSIDSNLGTVTVSVAGGPTCAITSCTARVPANGAEGVGLGFTASVATAGCTGSPAWSWAFGDGQSSAEQNPLHAYARSGTYGWTMQVAVDGKTCNRTGRIAIAGRAPSVSEVTRLPQPFQIRIRGANFHSAMEVTIAGTPWTNLVRSGSTEVTLQGGATLRNRFPANTWVAIQLRNRDDGMSRTIEYNRTTNRWRPVG